jgi:chromosome segregation ATPase
LEQIHSILTILTEVAPLVLSVIVLSGVVITVLWIIGRITIPALKELMDIFEAQRTSWRDLVSEQRKFYERIASDLEGRIEELEKEGKTKDSRIADLEQKIVELEVSNVAKDILIEELQKEISELKTERDKIETERDEIRAERDEIKARLKALEEKTKNAKV